MEKRSLSQIATDLRQGKLSSVALTQDCIDQIKKHQDLNAITALDEEQALIEAAKADQLLQKGQGKPLTGIPMAVKDVFCTKRMLTTCGSKMLAQYQSPFDAHIVEALQNAGAILLAKTNMDEFAMGSSNENSYFGPVKNPWDTNRVPGGSSGGSAACVAADMVPFSIGSDTGGSIRQPAAFCGISGIKPTYGLVSRFGMVAYASSLDQAGPMAKSAEDLALVLQAMAGFDKRDSTSISKPIPNYVQNVQDKPSTIKIGLPSAFFQADVEPGVQKVVLEAVELLKSLGAEIIDIDLGLLKHWVPCYYVVACAEASSNLSRFDGVRYGYRSPNHKTIQELITNSRSEGFGKEVKRRIITGTHVLSSGYFDAYYLQAQKIRRMIRDELNHALSKVDCILGPTTPTTAFNIGEKRDNPIQNYLADVFTVAANLAGLPAMSVPAGFSNGLPVGLQLIGNAFSESRLLQIAHHYQQHSNWHLASPNI